MLALVSCYDHPESNNSVCIFCRHNSKDLETVCTRRGMACFTEYRNALPYIYIIYIYILTILTTFSRTISDARALPWPWLSEFRGVVLSCYTLSSTTEVFPYSVSWVMYKYLHCKEQKW